MEIDWLSLVPVMVVVVAVMVISIMLIRMRGEEELKNEDAGDLGVGDAQVVTNRNRRTGIGRMRRNTGSRGVENVVAHEDGSEIGESGSVAGSSGKIKKKKESHREAKRAATAAREAALEAQRERDAAKREREDEEKQILEAEKAEQTEREHILEEERLKKEQEEYDQWKDMFSVENTGDQDEEIEAESQGLLGEFVHFIKLRKVVVLEELASEFNLRTEQAINRVQALEKMGHLTGVFDERGKYIEVSLKEMEELAEFIRKRGRVSIRDISEYASNLILSSIESSSETSLQSTPLPNLTQTPTIET